MSDSEKTKIIEKLRDHLPYGYITKIYDSLNKQYSKSYIGQVLDPKNNRWNDEIIGEASKVAIKNKKATEEKIKVLSELI